MKKIIRKIITIILNINIKIKILFFLKNDNGNYLMNINPYKTNDKIFLTEKNVKKITDYFAKYPNKLISYGYNNESVDGSGILSSVDKNVSINITNYIYKKFNVNNYKFKPIILDIGAGQGWLTKAINEKDMIGYGFEGSKNLLKKIISDHIYIFDLTKKIKEINLYKSFNITTSFEVAEHVPPEHQKLFWENISYLSDYHLCSIHKCPPASNIHPTIWTNEQWLSFFKKNNIEVLEVISQEIFNKECVGYPKNKIYIPIKNIRGNWPCSLFYLLKF